MGSNDVMDRLRAALEGRADVRLAVMFGSRARGTARPDSDVDVAVDAPGVDEAALARDLERAIGCEIDLVPLDTESIPLLSAIVRDGVVIHEDRRGAGAIWRSRALALLEIDLPWFRRMNDAYLTKLAATARVRE